MIHFTRKEFIRNGVQWFGYLAKELPEMLDAFREQWGAPVHVSPSQWALGRHNGTDGTSQHNVDRDGILRAVDLMPEGIKTRADMERAVDIAKRVGFTGIGVYPDWRPRPGIHVDTREDRVRNNPAQWGAVRDTPSAKQRYTSTHEALSKLE